MRALVLSLVVLASCAKQGTGEPDAGPETPEDFQGESTGIIPEFDPDALDAGDGLVDGGIITVDGTCCTTAFHIDDVEPVGAKGAIVGDIATLSSVALTRTDAGWVASVCMPIATSSSYEYEFRSDGGFYDAGLELEDGGVIYESGYLELVSRRASPFERSYAEADGTLRNFYRAVSSCSEHDGGVP